MYLDCMNCTAKNILGILNFIWMLFGCFLFYLGVRLFRWNSKFENVAQLAEINFKTTSFAILSIGVAILVICFIGFVGSCCKLDGLLNLYATLLLLIIVVEMYIFYLVQHYNMNIQEMVEYGMHKEIRELRSKNHTLDILEHFQYYLGCCGWSGPNDYSIEEIPRSCCGIDPNSFDWNRNFNESFCSNMSDALIKDGCGEKLKMNELVLLFGRTFGAGLFVIVCQLLLVSMAYCLAREFSLNYYNHNHYESVTQLNELMKDLKHP